MSTDDGKESSVSILSSQLLQATFSIESDFHRHLETNMFNHFNILRTRRRDFLQTAGAATLGALASENPRVIGADDPPPKAHADCMILLWMAGGMASTETFDPKPYTPFEKGMDPSTVLSTFPKIDTVCDHIKISKGLERIASIMDRATLIRSYTAGNLGHILHSRHQHHWHTGYPPQHALAAPHIGAVVTKILGPRTSAVPAFVTIGQGLGGTETEDLRAFHTAGFLGSEYSPFSIPSVSIAASAAALTNAPKATKPNPHTFPRDATSTLIGQFGSRYQKESLQRRSENEFRLARSFANSSFDLSSEPNESLEKYDTGQFGRGCLLARRLVEAGARFIEVTTEYTPFSQWDTHENGHARTARLKQEIDSPVAQLVLDLEERGLLDRTLIVLASEFSRQSMSGRSSETIGQGRTTPSFKIQTLKSYGLHRHFTGAGSILMFGGGLPGGHLHGATANQQPCTTIKDPVVIEDLHATIYKTLGIAPQMAFKTNGRHFHVTRNGQGSPIQNLFT